MKRIVETLLEEGIDESMIHRILDLIEEEYTLYTGAAPEEKEFKVKTTHDNGSFITKVKAKDAQTAHKLVAKMHGGPDSAHKVIEECECSEGENLRDTVRNMTNNPSYTTSKGEELEKKALKVKGTNDRYVKDGEWKTSGDLSKDVPTKELGDFSTDVRRILTKKKKNAEKK